MSKKAIGLMVLASLLLFAAVGIPAKAAGKEVLKKESTIVDKNGNIKIGSDYLFTQKGEELTLLDIGGKPIKDAVGLKIAKKDGAFVLYRRGKLLKECAVFTQDGKTIIPYGPAVVERLNDHYWTGTFAKKETKDKSKALIYSTQDTFSLQPKEGDRLYIGEMKAYSAGSGKAVKGVKITSPAGRIRAAGKALYVTDGKGSSVIYDKNGKALEKNAGSYSIAGSCFTKYEDGKTKVCDSNLKTLFDSEYSLSGFGQNENYFYFRSDNYPGLVSKKGKVLFKYKENGSLQDISADVSTIDKKIPDLVVFASDKKKGDMYPHFLLDTKGKVVNKTAYSGISYLGGGYLKGSRKDGSATVYDVMDQKGKVIGKSFDYIDQNMIASKDGKNAGEKEYYVYDKKAYDLKLKGSSTLGPGLVKSVDEKTGKYGVYDVISGKKVLDEKYDSISYIYKRVYALKDGSYEVYTLNR